MKKLSILAAAFAFVCTLGLSSCEKPNEGVEFSKWTLTADKPLTITEISHDETAAYPVCFTLKLVDGQIVAEGSAAHPTEAALSNNLPDNPYPSVARIADCGEIKGLTKIKEYPAETAYAPHQVAAIEHGYVIEAHGSANINSYGIAALKDPTSVYTRVWIESEVEGGFVIRYEVPFVVED